MMSCRSLSVKRKQVRFTVKREGTNESKTIAMISGREGCVIIDAPLPLFVQVDIKFSCTQTLFLINREGQISGQIELGEIISDFVCIKPSEFLNSREIINGVICNWDMHATAKASVVGRVIWEMNGFDEQMSKHRNRLLLHVDVNCFGDHILDEQSPAYDMLEDGMEYISVVSADVRKRKRLHHSRSHSHSDDDDHDDSCVICFSEFCSEDRKLVCPCLHVFHRNCIVKWLIRTPSCPICRFEMKIYLNLS